MRFGRVLRDEKAFNRMISPFQSRVVRLFSRGNSRISLAGESKVGSAKGDEEISRCFKYLAL